MGYVRFRNRNGGGRILNSIKRLNDEEYGGEWRYRESVEYRMGDWIYWRNDSDDFSGILNWRIEGKRKEDNRDEEDIRNW